MLIFIKKRLSMCRELLHIYGPLSINSYGTCILIGIVIGLWLFLRDDRRIKLVSTDQTVNGFMLCIVIGLIGARVLAIAENPESFTTFSDIFALWKGGFSFLGAVVSIAFFLPLYLAYQKIPILPTLDLASIYVLFMESIARLGCFMAGCCYGKPTYMPWGIVYTNQDSLAPLYTKIHPTQLYSAGLALSAFCCLYILSKKIALKQGQLFALCLLLTSSIRFCVDFWRADREFLRAVSLFSIHQLIALGIIACALILYIIFGLRKSTLYANGSI